MAATFEQQLTGLRRELELGREELERTIQAAPGGLFGVAPRGEWSVSAMLKHVIGAEYFYASAVETLRERPSQGVPAGLAAPADGAAALTALRASRGRLLAALDGVGEEEFYRMKQLGPNEESIKSIMANVAMHDHEHARQIATTVAEVAG